MRFCSQHHCGLPLLRLRLGGNHGSEGQSRPRRGGKIELALRMECLAPLRAAKGHKLYCAKRMREECSTGEVDKYMEKETERRDMTEMLAHMCLGIFSTFHLLETTTIRRTEISHKFYLVTSNFFSKSSTSLLDFLPSKFRETLADILPCLFTLNH